MGKKPNLTSIQVFEQRFSMVPQGYSTEDVNTFLDLVIEDYQQFEALPEDAAELPDKISELTQRNIELSEQAENINRQNKLISEQKFAAESRVTEVLRQSEDIHNADIAKIEGMTLEVATLKERIKELEEKIAEQSTPQTYNQLEVLKRIARIEQKVFGKD